MPKKILEFSSDSQVGGATRHILTLVKTNKEKYKFILVGCPGWFISEAQKLKLRYFSCNLKSAFDFKHILKLRKFIKTEQPNLIHLHGIRAGAVGFLATLFLKVPVIYSEHLYTKDYHLKSWLREKIQVNFLNLILHRVQKIIVPSRAVKEFLIEILKVKTTKIVIVYNGLEEKNVKLNSDVQLKIGFVGSLNEQKGVEYLIAAMHRLIYYFPKLKLEIVGDGPLRSFLENQAKDLKNKIKFVGAKQNIYSYLKSWKLLVIPSISESFGQVALEAAIAEKPVVASRVGGLPEVVLNHKTGILIEPKNVDELVKAITYLLNHSKIAQKMGVEAKSRFKQKFTAQKMIKNINLIYDEIAN